jgi:glycosyltransferase involved in cell wall biosynthesis
MNGQPLVSIVTPSFNQGRFLRRTIESVLAQDYPRIEYAVRDGGSTDDTLDVLRSYGSRLSWVSEPDAGQAQAINRGFAVSAGVIRAFLNSDDILLAGAVTEAVRQLTVHPEWDLVYGEADYIDEDDRITGRYATGPFSSAALWRENLICQPAAFWRAGAAARVGPLDESLHYALDYEYWLRMDSAGLRLGHVPVRLAASRLHAGAKTSSARRRVFAELLALRKRFGRPVGRTYYVGLWHYRLQESRGPLGRTLLGWKRLYQAVGWIHHRAASVRSALEQRGKRGSRSFG